MLESVSCNLCGSQKTLFLSKVLISPIQEISDLVKCRNCGLVYINPRHPVNTEKEFYATAYHEAQKPEVWKEYRLPFFRKALSAVNSFSAGYSKKLLDIGCGMGFFLDLARQDGWEGKGIDISDSAVAYGRGQLKLDIFKGELKDSPWPANSFDTITSWNVLDQYYDPLGMVRETYRLLKPAGAAFFRISNANFHLSVHFVFKILRNLFLLKKKRSEPTVFHIYMFSPRTIKKLLQQAGFKKIIVRNSPVTPVVADAEQLVGKRLNQWFNFLVFATAQIIFYLSFKRFAIGSSLMVVARK